MDVEVDDVKGGVLVFVLVVEDTWIMAWRSMGLGFELKRTNAGKGRRGWMKSRTPPARSSERATVMIAPKRRWRRCWHWRSVRSWWAWCWDRMGMSIDESLPQREGEGGGRGRFGSTMVGGQPRSRVELVA